MNTITIQQSKKETELAISVHQNAAMNSIRLARTKVGSERPEIALKEPLSLSMNVKTKHIETEEQQLLIEVIFKLTGLAKSEPHKNKASVSIECTFEVSYKLKDGFEPTSEQIKAFKDGNAIFNCWPFCRQFVQDITLRIGYPPITLPFLSVLSRTP